MSSAKSQIRGNLGWALSFLEIDEYAAIIASVHWRQQRKELDRQADSPEKRLTYLQTLETAYSEKLSDVRSERERLEQYLAGDADE